MVERTGSVGPATVAAVAADRPRPGASERSAAATRVAYLINQYPKVSHTFIRREIAALEGLGVSVERWSIRAAPDELVDPADRAEAARTRVVLAEGGARVARAVAAEALRSPMRFLRALRLALRTGWRSSRGLLRHLAYLAEACVCSRWLRAAGIRHVHAHFGTNAATVAMLCSELGGSSFSFTVHGPEEFDMPAALSLAEKVRRAAFTVAISGFGRSQLLRHAPSEAWRRIHVVRCGVDASFAARPSPPPAAPRLVFIGRLCAEKGLLVLLDAAAQVRASGVALELVIGGDGPLRGELDTAIASRGLGDCVRVLGWCSEARVREEIAAARALVLPSFAEGLPVVLMEALALGRPVISTWVAGIPELVRAGENGWLVTAGDAGELAAAMRQALELRPEMLEQLGRAGMQRVHSRHDVRTEAAALRALLESAARG